LELSFFAGAVQFLKPSQLERFFPEIGYLFEIEVKGSSFSVKVLFSFFF